MINSKTTAARVLRARRQISYHKYRVSVGGLDQRKTNLTNQTVDALNWSLTLAFEALEHRARAEVTDKWLDKAIGALQKIKERKHHSKYTRIELEMETLRGLDLDEDFSGE